jgi:triosephosphate isomerase (TIM)
MLEGMGKKKLVIGNWKMELSYKASVDTALGVVRQLKDANVQCDVVICPSFTVLVAVAEILSKDKRIKIGAQNVHWEERGAWTGEVGVNQIKPWAAWCVVGHSERRALTGETDEQVRMKTETLLQAGIRPIVCVGESDEEREEDRTVEKVTHQVSVVLNSLTRVGLSRLTIAYEPIWAIGSGVAPVPDDAAEILLLVRKLAAEKFGGEAANKLRLLYGGSVTGENAEGFLNEPGIDGVLVGGASTRPRELLKIIEAAGMAEG